MNAHTPTLLTTSDKLRDARIAVMEQQAAYDTATRLSRANEASDILPRLKAAVNAQMAAENALAREVQHG